MKVSTGETTDIEFTVPVSLVKDTIDRSSVFLHIKGTIVECDDEDVVLEVATQGKATQGRQASRTPRSEIWS